MSPQQPPPQRSDSGGARLNAFPNQVPAAHHFPLMHVERPSGQQPPPKAKPAPRPAEGAEDMRLLRYLNCAGKTETTKIVMSHQARVAGGW
ncbi:hypothetical protein PF011_g30908 [Phytophthora fragariae]|uniref:Uncharacterized protein n=1 Tax=Phytophthora fragariae TaxID=53985 RepID=A0A6A3GHY3_9STRA|nr:hypothetical protein PF011_g30908 [Phytophthora fragariae]